MPNAVYFFLAVAALIVGFAIYSRVVEKLFGADFDREMPAERMAERRRLH